jgi:hypothetical protein
MIKLRVVAATSVIVATLMFAGPSLGNDLASDSQPPAEWEFRLTPYAWLLNLNGDVTARGITSDVDVTFGDLVDKSDSLMAFTGLVEARRGKFSLFADVVWADLSFSGSGTRQAGGGRAGNPINRVPKFNAALDANLKVNGRAELDYESTIIQSGATYEVANWSNANSHTAFDLLAGARYWKQEVDMAVDVSGSVTAQLSGNATVNPRDLVRRVLIANGLKPDLRKVKIATGIAEKKGVSPKNGTKTLERTLQIEFERALAGANSGDMEWVDPFIGARIRHEFGGGQILTLVADVGGFGAGSDFSWQTIGTFAFDVNCLGTPINTVVGYRALAVDYSEDGAFGDNGMDLIEHGPILGLNLRW